MEESFRVITLKNPTTQPFNFTYNNTLTRTIPPGMALRMPWNPLGILASKHLIDMLCNINKENSGDPAIRAKYQSQILIDDVGGLDDKPLKPEEVLQKKLDLLNQTNRAEMITTCPKCNTKVFNLPEHNALNHDILPPQLTQKPDNPPQAASPAFAPPIPPPPPPVVQTPAQKMNAQILQNAVGSKEGTQLPEQKMDEVEAPPPPVKKKEDWTREEMTQYAKDVLKMDMNDAKTKEFLETGDLEVVRSEILHGL